MKDYSWYTEERHAVVTELLEQMESCVDRVKSLRVQMENRLDEHPDY